MTLAIEPTTILIIRSRQRLSTQMSCHMGGKLKAVLGTTHGVTSPKPSLPPMQEEILHRTRNHQAPCASAGRTDWTLVLSELGTSPPINNLWSWAMPRAILDFTVPKGTPRVSAISL